MLTVGGRVSRNFWLHEWQCIIRAEEFKRRVIDSQNPVYLRPSGHKEHSSNAEALDEKQQ